MLTDNIDYFDRLAIYSTIMQIMDLALLMGDASNSDIIRELNKQNKEYMEKIIEQNNKILSMLEKSISTEK